MIFSFLQCASPKNRACLRGFACPSAPDRHRANNFPRPENRKGRTPILYLFVCFNHFSPKTSIIDSHHLLLVSSHVLNSLVAFYGNFRSSPLIPFKILQKLSLLLFGGNVAMWACKVSVVSNLVGLLTRLCSRFSGLLPNLGKSGKSLAPVCSRLEFLALSLRP